MITTFKGKKITGMLGILPETEYDYDQETKDFADLQTKRLKKIMGFGKRRAAKADSTTADFCLYGLRYLLEKGLLKKEDIGAVIVVTVTPDYMIPHISNIIHGEIGLARDVVCMDIAQGCAALMAGLNQAYMVLEHLGDKKAVVFTGDVLCRKRKEDKLSAPSFGGDGASITIVENQKEAPDIYTSLYTDGSGRDALIMHAGGYRMPRTPETAIPVDIGDGTKKPMDEIWMNGSKVFNFVQKEVPPMVDELLQYAGQRKEEIDWFLFHQPNKFMLQKLADRMKVPHEKLPMNIVENFGNSSGSCMPINITFNLGEKLLNHTYRCCLSAFGSGLAWGASLMELGRLDFCEWIVSDL